MKEFIEYIIKNLVDSPDQVSVNLSENENGWLIQVKVAADDVGKIIGRKGMTIKSLRTLALSVCARLGHRVRLEIVE